MTTFVQSNVKIDASGQRFRYVIAASNQYQFVRRLEKRFDTAGLGGGKVISLKKAKNGAFYSIWRMRGNIQILLARRIYHKTLKNKIGNQKGADRADFIAQLEMDEKKRTKRTYGIPGESQDSLRELFLRRKARRLNLVEKWLGSAYGSRVREYKAELKAGDYSVIARQGGDYQDWIGLNDCQRRGVDYGGMAIAWAG